MSKNKIYNSNNFYKVLSNTTGPTCYQTYSNSLENKFTGYNLNIENNLHNDYYTPPKIQLYDKNDFIYNKDKIFHKKESFWIMERNVK